MDLNKILNEEREKEKTESQSFEAEQQRRVMERIQIDKWKHTYLLPKLRLATLQDYKEWLRGFLELGSRPTHAYDYPFAQWEWHIAIENIEMRPLCGSQSICIIVPKGIKIIGDVGHCNLFFMENFTYRGSVPIFNDIIF